MLDINFNPFPELRTDRLILREMVTTDAADFFLIRSNKLIMERLDKDPAQTIEDAKPLMLKIKKSIEENAGINWALCLKSDKKQIGIVGFHYIYKEHHRAEIGYALLPSFQRQGIMRETITAMLKFGFESLKFNSIEAKVNPSNSASINLLQGFGFEKEGYFKQSYYFKGKYSDTAIYSLLKDS